MIAQALSLDYVNFSAESYGGDDVTLRPEVLFFVIYDCNRREGIFTIVHIIGEFIPVTDAIVTK